MNQNATPPEETPQEPEHSTDSFSDGSGAGVALLERLQQAMFSRGNEPILSPERVDQLLDHSGTAEKVVSIPAQDMVQAGFEFDHESDQDKAKELSDWFDQWGLNDVKLFELIHDARAYGGAVLWMRLDDGRPQHLPLIPARTRRVLGFEVVSSRYAIPLAWYDDPNEEKFNEPLLWQITLPSLGGSGSLTERVHESRLIPLRPFYIGAHRRLQRLGWTYSVLQKPHQAMKNYMVTGGVMGGILSTFVHKFFKVDDRPAGGAANSTKAGVSDKYFSDIQTAQQMLDTFGWMVLGQAEEVSLIGTPVTGLADLHEKLKEMFCSEIDIPKSRFFQASAGQLGGKDAGETDRLTYYESIAFEQKCTLLPVIRRLKEVRCGITGEDPSSYKARFNPLQQESEAQKVENLARYLQAATEAVG